MIEKQKITIYSCSDPIRAALRTAFKGVRYELLEITDASKSPRVDINEQQQPGTAGRLHLPEKVDAVITTTGLNKSSEGLAATLALKQGRNDVYPIVLPEALGFLRERLDRYGELVLVGSDQSR